MKRMLCSLLAAVMLCLSLTVPVYAQEGVVPTAREYSDELAYFVELRRADLDAEEYTRGREEGGIATLTCAQEDAWWVERYGSNVPEMKIIFRVPHGAHSYKAVFLKELPTGRYVFGEDAITDNVFFPDDPLEQPEVHLDYAVGTIENNALVLDKEPFYALITWFDGDGAPLDDGKIEYIKVVTSFPNASSVIELPKEPVVPLPEEQLHWSFVNMFEGDFSCDMDTPGVQRITFLYTLQDWADSWNRYGHCDPAVEAMILAPEDAVAYMELRPSQVENFDADALLAQTQDWRELESIEFFDEMRNIIPLYYNVGEINEADGKYYFTSKAHMDEKLIVWKKSDGTLVDVGAEQYIQRFVMRIDHDQEHTYENAEIEKLIIDDMIAYDGAEPIITSVYEQNGTRVPDTDTLHGELSDGTFAIQASFTQADYQEIYDSKPAGNEQLWCHVKLPMPEGAVNALSYASEEFEPAAHEFIPESGYWAIDVNGELMVRSSVTYASVRRHESTIMIDPVDVDKWLYVMWVDEHGEPVNIGTQQRPCYVEYLHITFSHESHDSVGVTDSTTVSASDVVLNGSGWESGMFSREPEFVNSEAVYYVNRSRLTELQEQNGGQLPEAYSFLHTRLKAPQGAEGYELTLTTLGEQTEGTLGEEGYIDLKTSVTETYEGEQRIIESLIIEQYSVRWLDADGNEIAVQKLSVTVWMTMDETWMDIMEGGSWDPAEKDRIGSTADNTDIVIVSGKDGAARNQYEVDCPTDDVLNLTIKAPDDVDGITQYRMAAVEAMYVYLNVSDNEGKMVEARYLLDNFAPQPLGEDRAVVFDGLATFVTEEITVDRGNKNFTNVIYLHDTYNNNIEDSLVMFVEWMDDSGEVLKREYVYHELERLDRLVQDSRYRVEGSYVPDGAMLCVRHFRQKAAGMETGEGAFYLHMWMEDGHGNHVQPSGPVTVHIPYPDGADSKCDFVIEHYEDESHTGFKVESCECRADGIRMTLSSFSPFMLSWSEADDADDGQGEQEPVRPQTPPINGNDQPQDTEAPEEQRTLFTVLCRRLNVRAGAGTQYARIGTLTRDACIRGQMLPNGWVKFMQDDGTYAYVCGSYVEETEADGEEAVVICRRLNVRAGAGTQYARIGKLKRGDAVQIVDRCDGWYKITYSGTQAWICAKYVK